MTRGRDREPFRIKASWEMPVPSASTPTGAFPPGAVTP